VICNDFQANFDLYLDDEMAVDDARRAADHVANCSTCEALVTRSQQLNSYLVTAVTDRVAAVDVSTLWADIEAQLALDQRPLRPAARPSVSGPSIGGRLAAWLGALVGDDAFSAVRVGAMVAAAAVVVFVTSSTMTEQGPTAELGTSPVTVASTRTPGGRTRPVRIDAMEVAEGHTVSTWMRPKTKTRVIWVAASSPADGFSANPASMDR
jgi:hypothetical protein